MRIWSRTIAGILLLASAAVSARGATVDPPQRVKVQKLDRSELDGRITSYDEAGFELMDAQKQTAKVSWDELPPELVMNLHERLVRKGAPQDNADTWLNLGKKMLSQPGGRGPAERAFRRAVTLDPTYKDKVIAARKEAGSQSPDRAATQPRGGKPETIGTAVDPRTATTQPRGPLDPRDPNKKVIGPQQVGPVDPAAWGKQSAEQQIANVRALKAFAEQSRQALAINLQPHETPYFLVYSDLSQSEAQKLVMTLDRMYARLAQLFGVPPTENIWHGKALVFVFSREEDYLKFEVKMHNTVAAGSAGMCHAYGSGAVHIAFYRQPNEADFAHVLVHESVHGFLHRYRSPVEVPSWLNEGLAEAIASDLVPRKGLAQSSLADARQDLQTRKSLGKFFDAESLVAWQYPVARTLTEFMIRQNKQGYVEFLNAIKDNVPWDQALQAKYGVTPEQLLAAYGQSLGVAGLKP
ncbi:MAG TPA: hypothetical protein VER17_17260 [Tepidisphaeraceae bacterium]|nr:hypothetical protein [Tepidisphaeraceae bacterium]